LLHTIRVARSIYAGRAWSLNTGWFSVRCLAGKELMAVLIAALSLTAVLAAAIPSMGDDGAVARSMVLKCRVSGGDGAFDLKIDLGNQLIEFGNSLFDILQVHEKSITGILRNPRLMQGEEVIVLNRETGNYVVSNVSLTCADQKCLNQIGPDVTTFRGNCGPPVF